MAIKMKKIIKGAVKYFLFLFFVIEVIPYIADGGNLLEIGLQTIVIAFFSVVISIFSNGRKELSSRD